MLNKSNHKNKRDIMANTYTQIYIHIVFAVENRISLIKEHWREELHNYITGIIQNHKHKLIAINSVPNHIHIFIVYLSRILFLRATPILSSITSK